MNQTGGIFYHYLALRNSLKYWRPYQAAIDSFLHSFDWSDQEINYWIGTSGGYSLPKSLVRDRLSRDYFCDPEFLAEMMFSYRHGKARNWVTNTGFDFSIPQESAVAKLAKDAKSKGVTRLIFCNILGQLSLLNKKLAPSYWESVLSDIKDLELPVISYHDYFTFHAKAKLLDILQNVEPPKGELQEKDINQFLQEALSTGELGVVDHQTKALAKYSRARAWWRKDKTTLHLIDCIYIEKK